MKPKTAPVEKEVSINNGYAKAQLPKTVWFDARNLDDERKTLALVNNMRFENLLIRFENYGKLKAPRRMKLIVEVTKAAAVESLPKEVTLCSKDIELLRQVKSDGYSTTFLHQISNQDEMDAAWQLGQEFDNLVVEFTSVTNIPLELLIARLQKKSTRLLKIVDSCQDAEIAFGVMEAGSDGVVLSTSDLNEIKALDKLMSIQETGKLELFKADVVDIQHMGMGHRSCVDTTTLMKQNEGMLVGSTAQGGILVSSETHFLPYMDLRPFRVNAGAVHSYIWAPDDMTRYLTELKVGSKVLCIDTEGNTRSVTVGRVKTEVRPLVKIEVEVKGVRLNTIVQDDWHIRILGADGKPRNASTIKEGDSLLAYLSVGARHVGIKIEEKLEEK